MKLLRSMGKVRGRNDGLEIVYEDQWLIVVNKPSGLLSISTGKPDEDTAHARLYDHYGRIFIVHRLDRDTSGLLIFAKDQDTKSALQENWEDAVLERRYIAVLEGEILDEEGWIESWLYENRKSMKVHCYGLRPGDKPETPPRKDWQYASTHCHTLKHIEIDGDRKYEARTNPFGRLALHAKTLAFIHPWTGKTMRFTTDTPRSFRL